jgi:hypothetical protein
MLTKIYKKIFTHTLLVAGLISANCIFITQANAQNINLDSAKYSVADTSSSNNTGNNSNNTNVSNASNAQANNSKSNSSVVTTAQNNSKSLDTQSQVKTFAKTPTNFTFEVSTKLDSDLSSQNYSDFFSTLESANVSSDYYEHYLLTKTDDGIPPVYWVLSNYYTHQGKIADAKRWLYTAIITTQQDQNLCLDKSSRVATNQLIHAFPDTIDMDRKNPQYNQKAIQDAIFFIKNLKTRAFPGWVCNFGQDPVKPGMSPVMPRAQWSKEYQRILDDFTRNLSN